MIMGRVARELNLTDQQKVEIKAIIEAERPRVEPLVRQLAATRRELREATANGQFDEAQVGALASRQGQTLAQLIVEKERVKSQVYGVLTPEQRAKAAEIINRIESRIRQRAAEHGFEF
jgi:Spy/CpxP family protein refolding chaperone